MPGGKIGYDCFIVISAWFIAEKAFDGNRYMRIVAEAIFYNIVGMTLAVFLNNGLTEPITLRSWLGCILPIFGCSHGFVALYLIFLMILPLLQGASKNMSKKNIISIVCLLFMMEIGSKIIQKITGFEGFVDFNNSLFTFIIIYFIVVCLQRWPLKITENRYWMAAIVLTVWGILSALNVLAQMFPETGIISMALAAFNGDISPLNIVAGFCLFFIFKDMKIKHNVVINVIASHMFGILLLHDHNYFRYVIWTGVFRAESFYNVGIGILIIYILAVAAIVFAAGILMDTVRERFFEKTVYRLRAYDRACAALEGCFKIADTEQ